MRRYQQSFWDLLSERKQLTIEHHENWYTERMSVQSFPGDESFSRDLKGKESTIYSRENETLFRNIGKYCKFVDKVPVLTTEQCSPVQALIAAQLVSKCR